VQTAVVLVAIGILSVIAYGDVRTRHIPNVLAFAIAILGLAQMILDCDLIAALRTIAASAAVFAAAFLLFCRGMLGGGDAKLIAATALLIGYHDLVGFLFLMSVCGGALALAILAREQLYLQRWHRTRSARVSAEQVVEHIAVPIRSTVPYAVAIAGAGVIVLILRAS